MKNKIALILLLAASVGWGNDTLHIKTLCVDRYYSNQNIVVEPSGFMVRCTFDNCSVINNGGVVSYNTFCFDEIVVLSKFEWNECDDCDQYTRGKFVHIWGSDE